MSKITEARINQTSESILSSKIFKPNTFTIRSWINIVLHNVSISPISFLIEWNNMSWTTKPSRALSQSKHNNLNSSTKTHATENPKAHYQAFEGVESSPG